MGTPASIRILLVAVAAGLAIGIATSVAQGLLPEGLASLANSSGSWCLCAFALALLERDPRRAALVGFASLVAMLVGYALATELRGYPVGTSMFVRWGAAAVIAGPALGVGAAWLRGPDPLRAAAGVAPIAGILLGEGLYGLTVVAATTSVAYWIGEVVARPRARGPRGDPPSNLARDRGDAGALGRRDRRLLPRVHARGSAHCSDPPAQSGFGTVRPRADATRPPAALSGSGSRGARIHTSCAVVSAPTLDRAFARWCFTVDPQPATVI